MGVLVVETEAADPWIPPPPKKKWIRHYLRGEIPKDYTTFSSTAAAELSPLASSPPSPPSAPVPAPPPNHLPTTNGLCSYSPPSSSASSSPPPPLIFARPPPSPPPPPPHPTPPADTHLSLREDTPPPPPQYVSTSPLRLPHHPLPTSPLQPPPPLPSSSTSAPILHNHLHQHQHQQRPPSPRSACTSPSSSSSVSAPSSSSAVHNPPFHDFQTDGGYAGVKSEDGEGGGGGTGGGAISSSSSPSRTFRRITVSSQLARLEEAQELRRRVGSGTREVHNKLEKNRRAHLKECFELLKKQLPASQDEKKSSNLSILHSALRYIQILKRKERDYEHEMERLAREKIASQQRLSALKKELSAQWDHIDFNALLPPDSVLSAPGGGASPRRPPDDEEDEEREGSGMGADGGNSSFGDRMRSRKDLGLPITSDHNSNSTSTASERGHLSDDAEDVLPPRGHPSFTRGPPLLLRHSLPSVGGKRSPRPIHGGSAPTSPTPPPPPQRSSVLQQHRLAPPSATPPSSLPASPTHTPPPRPLAAPGSPRPTRRLSPSRQLVLPEMHHHHHHHPEEMGIAVTTNPTAHVHVPAQVVRAPPGLATALVSPGTAIHLLTTSSPNHQRHHMPSLHQTGHGPHLQQLRVPTNSSTCSATSPKTSSPISSNSSSPSSPMLLGSPSQQPLALTMHAHPVTNHHFHHSSHVLSVPHKCRDQDAKTPAVSSTTSANAISVPTIHLAGKVVQHPVAFLGPPTTNALGAPDLSHDLDGSITSSSSGKYGSQQPHHLSQQPAVAITGGSITLPNGVVAHASSANAGVTLAQAASPANSARGSLPTSLTLAHSPTSGGTTTMLTTAIHGAGTTPISALPTHLTQAGITHLVAPIGGGHAALVTTSGGGAGAHPLMTPLALVSSTGGPVAAHILGAAPASGSGAMGGTVGGKVMASGAAGALPLLKPVAVGGQLPLMNAQYLTTATALGGLAHLVKPLVVVSSAHSVPNHGSSSKLPSSLATRSEPSPPQ